MNRLENDYAIRSTTAPGGFPDPKCILLLEQNPLLRSSIRNSLLQQEYRVLETINREHAATVLRTVGDKIDLMLGNEGLLKEAARQLGLRHSAPMIHVGPADTRDELFARVDDAIAIRPRKTRVLVVDDEFSSRDLLASLLRSSGYEVMTAGDGYQAVRTITATPFDIVVTELVMPEMEGLEVIERTRKIRPATACIAVTGSPRASTYLRLAKKLGASATFEKPFSVDELLSCLERSTPKRSLSM